MNEGLIYVGVVVCVYIELWDLYIKRQGAREQTLCHAHPVFFVT